MIIMKFGGSSLASSERIKAITKIVRQYLSEQPVVVLSALGKTTDNLIAAGQAALKGQVNIDEIRQFHLQVAQELNLPNTEILPLLEELEKLLKGISLLQELSPRTHDYLVSFGERLSVRLISTYFNQTGLTAKFFDAWDIGMKTDSNHMDAEILDESYTNINNYFSQLIQNYSFTPVITGFIAKDANGIPTTTGRGGSDWTASVIGAALKVKEIQVWKDVAGLLTTDPRVVPEATPVATVSFEEVAELAYFGANIFHPRSIRPAKINNIPVRIKNSYNPSDPGTVVVKENPEKSLVKAIAFKRNITVVDIVSSRMLGQVGFLSKLFEIFAQHNIVVDMISSSEVSVSVTLQNGSHERLRENVKQIANVDIKQGRAVVSVIGDVSRSSEILDKLFGALQQNNINVQMISQGSSKVNIGFVVNDNELEQCVKVIHTAFFGGRE